MKRTLILGIVLALAAVPAIEGSATTASNSIVKAAVSAGSINTLVAAVILRAG